MKLPDKITTWQMAPTDAGNNSNKSFLEQLELVQKPVPDLGPEEVLDRERRLAAVVPAHEKLSHVVAFEAGPQRLPERSHRVYVHPTTSFSNDGARTPGRRDRRSSGRSSLPRRTLSPRRPTPAHPPTPDAAMREDR